MMLKKSPALVGSVEKRANKEHANPIAKLRPPIDSPASATPLIRQTSI
jgi:hypothetical protein